MAVLRMRDMHKLKRWQNFKINKTWEKLDDVGRIMLDMKVRLGNQYGNFYGIKDAWQNEPCFVIGAGGNLRGFDLKKLAGYHTIGINHMIEYWDGYEWFIFLDNRFLNRTNYNINNFKGKIFSSNRCSMLSDHLDWYRFKVKPYNSEPDLMIQKGLFNGALTGLCALNLALISGANPIYMLGMDCIPYDEKGYHYKKEYNGEIKTEEKYKKYRGANRYFAKFKKWSKRIINVNKGFIETFPDVSIDELEKRLVKMPKPIKKPKIEIKQKVPTICHMITMSNMSVMGDISRQVYSLSWGNHIFCNINKKPPKADIYLLECFINGAQQYMQFQKPNPNAKVISLIHSSGRCLPARCSDRVITLTAGWQSVLRKRGYDSIVIPAGIDIKKYNKKINYGSKIFGRITRWSSGKVHPNWNNVVKKVLSLHRDAKCIMITKTNNKIQNKRVMYVENIKINDHQKKINTLSQMCVHADMHNTFQETFSLCLLEAMASGLACIMYSKAPQPSMIEILSDAGIICLNEQDFTRQLVRLLQDTEMKREYGMKAKQRACNYTIEKMIGKYNKTFKGIL
jgi:glycosyltransferase involved in cell wall biosynthesis